MKRIIFTFLLLVAPLASQVNQQGDVQFWEYNSFDKKLTDKLTARLIGEFRFGDDISSLYFTYVQGQVLYKANHMLTIGPGYRQEFLHSLGEWKTRSNPMIDFVFKMPFSSWSFQDRTRLLYHIPEEGHNQWIYRHRLRLTSPSMAKWFDLKWFIYDEVFFLQHSHFNQNRLATGLVSRITPCMRARALYLYRSRKSDNKWRYQNVLGLHLDFSF